MVIQVKRTVSKIGSLLNDLFTVSCLRPTLTYRLNRPFVQFDHSPVDHPGHLMSVVAITQRVPACFTCKFNERERRRSVGCKFRQFDHLSCSDNPDEMFLYIWFETFAFVGVSIKLLDRRFQCWPRVDGIHLELGTVRDDLSIWLFLQGSIGEENDQSLSYDRIVKVGLQLLVFRLLLLEIVI
jgi:hypothetical protein